MKPLLLALAAGAAATSALLVTPALGQGATSALQGHDTSAPVDVAADRIEVQDRSDRAIWSGNVIVHQGSLTLTSERLTIAYTNDGGIEIERLDASGGVTLRSPSETARGQFAIYDLNERLITMIGDVTLTRGQSHINGGQLVIDLDTGRAVMDGGAPGATRTEDGRVTGIFTVPDRN